MNKKMNIIQQFGIKIFVPIKGEALDIFSLQDVLENAMLIYARTTKQEVFEIEVTSKLPDESAKRGALIDELVLSVPGPLKEVAEAIKTLNRTIKKISRKYDKYEENET